MACIIKFIMTMSTIHCTDTTFEKFDKGVQNNDHIHKNPTYLYSHWDIFTNTIPPIYTL